MSHGAHIEGDGNKRVAILVSILVLCLAIAETAAKGSQTKALAANIEAANLWSFFQAKTIRQTMVRSLAEQMTIDVQLAKDPAVKQVLEKRINDWQATAKRWQSEPMTGPKGEDVGEGRDELSRRAIALQKERDLYTAKYHQYELSSAAFQIAIVLASSYVITNVVLLLWGSFALGGIGVIFWFIGLLAPKAVHILG
ncbi:MAG: hypothetical protein RL291_410 [Pseudomonadota bacterium]|jgi:hypothetical protein